jgi:hypothetical protein
MPSAGGKSSWRSEPRNWAWHTAQEGLATRESRPRPLASPRLRGRSCGRELRTIRGRAAGSALPIQRPVLLRFSLMPTISRRHHGASRGARRCAAAYPLWCVFRPDQGQAHCSVDSESRGPRAIDRAFDGADQFLIPLGIPALRLTNGRARRILVADDKPMGMLGMLHHDRLRQTADAAVTSVIVTRNCGKHSLVSLAAPSRHFRNL